MDEKREGESWQAGRQAGRQGQPSVREQFDALCREHASEWRAFARRLAGSRELGHDVFGESMRKVVARLDELDEITFGYVTTAIRNVAAGFGERARTRREGLEKAALEAEVHHPRPERPDQYTARVEKCERVRGAVNELPDEHRDVMRLTELQDMTQAEAAEELAMSERKVWRLRKEGLAMLHELLGGAPDEPAGDD